MSKNEIKNLLKGLLSESPAQQPVSAPGPAESYAGGKQPDATSPVPILQSPVPPATGETRAKSYADGKGPEAGYKPESAGEPAQGSAAAKPVSDKPETLESKVAGAAPAPSTEGYGDKGPKIEGRDSKEYGDGPKTEEGSSVESKFAAPKPSRAATYPTAQPHVPVPGVTPKPTSSAATSGVRGTVPTGVADYSSVTQGDLEQISNELEEERYFREHGERVQAIIENFENLVREANSLGCEINDNVANSIKGIKFSFDRDKDKYFRFEEERKKDATAVDRYFQSMKENASQYYEKTLVLSNVAKELHKIKDENEKARLLKELAQVDILLEGLKMRGFVYMWAAKIAAAVTDKDGKARENIRKEKYEVKVAGKTEERDNKDLVNNIERLEENNFYKRLFERIIYAFLTSEGKAGMTSKKKINESLIKYIEDYISRVGLEKVNPSGVDFVEIRDLARSYDAELNDKKRDKEVRELGRKIERLEDKTRTGAIPSAAVMDELKASYDRLREVNIDYRAEIEDKGGQIHDLEEAAIAAREMLDKKDEELKNSRFRSKVGWVSAAAAAGLLILGSYLTSFHVLPGYKTDRDKAVAAQQTAEKERDSATKLAAGLTKERDNLKTSLKPYTELGLSLEELKELGSNFETARTELEKATQNIAGLTAKRTELEEQLKAYTESGISAEALREMQANFETAKTERDEAVKKAEEAETERAKAVAAREEAETEVGSLTNRMAAEREELMNQIRGGASASKLVSEAKKEINELNRRLTAYEKLGSTPEELASAKSNYDAIVAARDNEKGKAERLTAEVEGLRRQLERARALAAGGAGSTAGGTNTTADSGTESTTTNTGGGRVTSTNDARTGDSRTTRPASTGTSRNKGFNIEEVDFKALEGLFD